MSIHRLQLHFVLSLAFMQCASLNASDLGHAPKLKTSLIPRKSGSARDRSSEVVQRTPDFAFWDGTRSSFPAEPGTCSSSRK